MIEYLVLNYHAIVGCNATNRKKHDPIYSISERDFIRQLDIISDLGIPIISLRTALQNSSRPNYCIVLTFDDGHPSDYEVVYPILKERNLPATFFISLSNTPPHSQRWEEYRSMSKNGFEIGSHGIMHKALPLLKDNVVRSQLSTSKSTIENLIKQSVDYFSLPNGSYNKYIVELARFYGYKALLTTKALTNYGANQFLINRWTVKRSTTMKEFERMIAQNPVEMLRKRIKDHALKLGRLILGNKRIDNINYAYHIWKF